MTEPGHSVGYGSPDNDVMVLLGSSVQSIRMDHTEVDWDLGRELESDDNGVASVWPLVR